MKVSEIMPHGKVKWFNDSKGYGFIARDEDDANVFVHYSSIEGQGFRSLVEGQEVEYDEQAGPKGLFAARVIPPAPSFELSDRKAQNSTDVEVEEVERFRRLRFQRRTSTDFHEKV
jgi:cold shock protein